MELLFWTSFGIALYALVGFPLILLAMWTVTGRKDRPDPPGPMRIGFLIPAHNEGAVIADKLRNTMALHNTADHDVSVVVVSDGSTDDTVAQARSIVDPRIQVIETAGRIGKLGALNLALSHLGGDILIFSDANAILAPQSLDRMMDHFSDPKVGGVCGQITIDTEHNGAISKADSLYWRYDQMLKRAESDLGGVVSAQGSIYAIRRKLTAPVQPGIADDFLMSVRVIPQGYRLAFEAEATTREAVTENAHDEIGRRIRSAEMGWRGIVAMREVLNPLQYGLYSWQLFSHKVMRYLVPFCLGGMFVAGLGLIHTSPFWLLAGIAQFMFYGVGITCWIKPALRKLPLASKVLFFCMANLATLIGLIAWIKGRESSVWTPVRSVR